MGTYSDFDISFDFSNEDDELKLLEWLDEFEDEAGEVDDKKYDLVNAIRSSLNGETWVWRKWYEFKKDMVEVSSIFPNVLFEVHVNSEDYGEYMAYFKKGKYYTQDPCFPDFDESKLTTYVSRW